MRETLGNVIPSELQQLHQSAARLSTNEDGKLCFLDIVNHKVQVMLFS
ncbi:unnamed protein product [Anisakis simplex]|uniref:Uncharacterized protein n=1 Tax=Anisakis simplex TaxID=6269 RepID=A0A3P6P4Y7_ANISI|nr:unnamed protein product [Anisakis simplex]